MRAQIIAALKLILPFNHECVFTRSAMKAHLLFLLLLLSALPSYAANALVGQARYLALCAGCHSATPDHRAKLAANEPDFLRLAVNTVSGMGFLQALLSRNDYDDIAAYIGDTKLNSNVLTVAARGAGVGRIVTKPGNINCGGVCAWGYPLATEVELEAIPAQGSAFIGWSGACQGQSQSQGKGQSQCRLYMNGAETAFAEFQRNSAAIDYAGLWWGGVTENGWGVSIAHRAGSGQQFVTLYIYDALGEPTWVVMPGGAWRDNFTALRGQVYRPRGAPLNNYSPDSFDAGTPIGEVTLRFVSDASIEMTYLLDGISGIKQLQRQSLTNDVSSPLRDAADLWWAGAAENGWGVSIAQQSNALFAVWYSYNKAGNATWFVMPGGVWQAEGNTLQVTGDLYKTSASAWIGAPYDASRLQAMVVGTLRLGLGETMLVNAINMRAQFTVGEFAGTNQVRKIVRQPF